MIGLSLGGFPVDVELAVADAFEGHGLLLDGNGDGGGHMARIAGGDGSGGGAVDGDGDGIGAPVLYVEVQLFAVDLPAIVGGGEVAARVGSLAQEPV